MGARPARAARWLAPLFLVGFLTSCVGDSGVVVVVGNEFDQTSPAVNGTMVAWEDSRNEEAGNGVDVYARDMTSGTETLIAGGRGDQGQPAVSDQYIVWVDDGAIRARLRTGGNTVNVAGGNNNFDPAVCGSFVVWTDMRNGNPDIYGRDLAGGQELPIATSPASDAYPDCDGTRVVYMSTGAVNGVNISLFDRTTGATAVLGILWNEWMPAISGSRVVWQAWPNQPNCCIQIKGVDFSTGALIPVTAGPGHQTMPDVSESIVVWQDNRNTNPQVWYLDLAGGTEKPVVMDIAQAPQVSGRRVVWQQQVNGSWDILMKDL
jgi:beta propeller repeat protein